MASLYKIVSVVDRAIVVDKSRPILRPLSLQTDQSSTFENPRILGVVFEGNTTVDADHGRVSMRDHKRSFFGLFRTVGSSTPILIS